MLELIWLIKFQMHQSNLILPLSINELKAAFFSFKVNKIPGHDGVSFNAIKKCFVELCKP